VAEDREGFKPAPEAAARDEGDDVEGHRWQPEPDEDKDAAATEEPPDVEGHGFKPAHKP
jgi:hypothetical protein